MTGTRIFLGFTALVFLAMVALLWQMFLPRSVSTAGREPPARPGTAPALRPTETDGNGVRSIYPGPGAPPPAARAQPRLDSPKPNRTDADSPPSDQARANPIDAPAPAAPRRADDDAEDDQAATLPPRADTPPPGDTAAPEGTDLNTATLQQLNELGAGMIGRTIIANRPYAAPEDLLTRRVLTRRDYETIRPRIVAR